MNTIFNTALVIFVCWLAVYATAIVIEVDNTNGYDTSSCCSESGGPCKTLDYALTNGLTSYATILIHEGVYNISLHDLSFYNLTDVAIYGVGSNLTIIECEFGTGLGFFNVTQLNLANFKLLGGGRLMNSTSINTTSTSGEAAVFRVALYLMDCSDVNIEGLVITNSTGTGIVMYDVTGKIGITNSVFQYNMPLETEELPGDGGVSILFTDCKPGKAPCIDKVINGTTYNIQSCIFLSNVATSSNSTEIFRPSPFATVYQQFGHGGGLSFITQGTTNNTMLQIKHCNFTENRAVWGGGLSIGLYGKLSRHQIILDNLLFHSNYLPHDGYVNITGTGGGAVRIAMLPNSGLLYTSITFSNCVFHNNSAIFGGGVSIEISREDPVSTTVFHFIHCTWKNNIARLGSALYAHAYPYPFGKVANFTIDSCRFINNTNHYTELQVKLQGIGTLYSCSVPVFFKGNNVFKENFGSAVVGIDAWFIFNNGTAVVFENNTAEDGGAIILFDNSYLILFENIQLSFTYNQAEGKGGAILVVTNGQRDLGSQYCFVNFYDITVTPYEWKQKNISVYFANNMAKFGNSIFATTLYACVWKNLTGLDEIPLRDVNQVFYWNGAFVYEGITNVSGLHQEISSEAVYVRNYQDTIYSIPPGKFYNFNFREENERMEEVDAVYFVTSNSSVAVVDNTETYSSNDLTSLHGNSTDIFSLKMVTINGLPLSVTVNVRLDECPPGYYLSSASNSSKSVCKCSVNVPQRDYLGIVECDNSRLVAFLRPEHYAGYQIVDGKKTLLTAGCPIGFCYSNSNNSYLKLPSNSSNTTLDNLICKSKQRTGALCGQCLEGNYIYVNSYDYECGKCTNSWVDGALMLTGLKYIPLTVFLYIVGLFGISLVDGPLNSAVLYSQLLPYMNVYAGGRISILNQDFVTGFQFLYGIWNLDFFELLAPNFCVLPIRSGLEMVLFRSLTPVVFGIMLSLLYILISERQRFAVTLDKMQLSVCKCISYVFCKCGCITRCLRKYVIAIDWLNRKVCFHSQNDPNTCFRSQGLITCVVLCYAKLTALAFSLLSNTKLYGPGKDNSEIFIQVFTLDGTKKYVEGAAWTLLVAIISIILVTLIPLVIFLYPILAYWYNNENRTVPRYICNFYDSLRLCYKNNCIARFFTAVYFCYRIGLLAIYAFTTTVHYQYLWQCGFFLSMLLTHCIVQPYKRRIYNIIDGIVFFIMTLISLLSLYRLYAVDLGLFETNKAFRFQLILIYLPFAYIVLLWPCFACYKYIKTKQLKDGNYIKKIIKFIDKYLLNEDIRENDEGRQSQDIELSESRTYQAI